MTGHPALQFGELGRVAAEQVEHVLRGADRPLDAAQRVAREQFLKPVEADEQFVGGGGEALAERGRLGGDVVRAPGHDEFAVLASELAQPRQDGDRPVADEFQAAADLQLLDVLGEIPGGHALVDLLMAGEGVELLDAGLDVVPGDPLAGGDGVEVDLPQHPLVVGRRLLGNLDAEVGLGAQHRKPQLALQYDLVLRGPQLDQFGRGVAGGEDVRNAGLDRHEQRGYRPGAPVRPTRSAAAAPAAAPAVRVHRCGPSAGTPVGRSAHPFETSNVPGG